jgi:hypothetical protein
MENISLHKTEWASIVREAKANLTGCSAKEEEDKARF